MSPSDVARRYVEALSHYSPKQLRATLKSRGQPAASSSQEGLIAALTDPRSVEQELAAARPEERLVFGLLAFAKPPIWSAYALGRCLTYLGMEPEGVLSGLVDRGWLAAEPMTWQRIDSSAAQSLVARSPAISLIPHPAIVAAAHIVVPTGPVPATIRAVRQIREADGLEPALRLSVIWQRVADSPLRRTQNDALYKRDRERLTADPCLSGPIADSLRPLPDPLNLWLELAYRLGLLEAGERIEAAAPSCWTGDATRLSLAIAREWLSIRFWNDLHGAKPGEWNNHFPFLRLAVLLTLARLGEAEWVTLAELAAHLDRLDQAWVEAPPVFDWLLSAPDPFAGPGRRKPGSSPANSGAIEAFLQGPAYLLGLVRIGEDPSIRQQAVQLTAFGRFVLGLGEPPPPHPRLQQFLLVQPNFDLIAYRQGLTTELIGRLACFAQWKQLGSVLELTLTPESVYRGLEAVSDSEQFLGWLAEHSARPVPTSLAEAVRTWSGRRERVTYYPSATLIEFATAKALEEALEHWPQPEVGEGPVRVTDRLLLVKDESTIPFQRFRLTGSRDYRQPPEACLELEADGVTLAVDLGRSDLLIDAELERLAEPLPGERQAGHRPDTRRRYRVTTESLRNALESGLNVSAIERWFRERTGQELSAAIRLLLYCAGPRPWPVTAGRLRVLRTADSDLLDGLLQHPATRDLLGERLGPTAAVVPEAALGPLHKALASLGLNLLEEDHDQ